MIPAIDRYLPAIGSLNLGDYRSKRPSPALKWGGDDQICIDYAPFDHIERDAQLVIVGLTPGRTQAANAYEALQRELASGSSLEVALSAAKRSASFSGAMRSNLLAMLDTIGVPAIFGRAKASEFFSADRGGVHFTSALRYPVFIAGGENYSGAPDPLTHPILKGMIDTMLAEEAACLSRAIWIPLGKHAEAALRHLISRGLMPAERVLSGMPHPSGANAERIAYFLGRKGRDALSSKTNPDAIDRAKRALVQQMRALEAGIGMAR